MWWFILSKLNNCTLFLFFQLSEVFEQEIDPVMQALGYCCGRKYTFNPQVLCCYGKQLCTIPRDAKYFSYIDRWVDDSFLYFFPLPFLNFSTIKSSEVIQRKIDPKFLLLFLIVKKIFVSIATCACCETQKFISPFSSRAFDFVDKTFFLVKNYIKLRSNVLCIWWWSSFLFCRCKLLRWNFKSIFTRRLLRNFIDIFFRRFLRGEKTKREKKEKRKTWGPHVDGFGGTLQSSAKCLRCKGWCASDVMEWTFFSGWYDD